MATDSSRLRALEDAFMERTIPTALINLDPVRSTILRFHREGYSRALTYEFLKSHSLIGCSRASFYRWVASHMDLHEEAKGCGGREHIEQQSPAPTPPPLDRLSYEGIQKAAGPKEDVVSSLQSTMISAARETLGSTLPIESHRSGRTSQVAALDAVLQHLQANDMATVASRALESLASRGDDEHDG